MVNRYYPEAGIKLISDTASRRYDEDDLFVQYTDYAALDIRHIDALTECERLEVECARLRQELSQRPLGVDEDPLTGRLR